MCRILAVPQLQPAVRADLRERIKRLEAELAQRQERTDDRETPQEA
jgi:hypothetical protein